MLEEQDRVLHPRGRLEEALGILGAARVGDVPARNVGEEALDVGRVPRAALDVTAHGDAADHRAAPGAGAAPAHRRDLVAHLHEGRPDVVSELDLHDRHVARRAHASGNAQDRSLGQGGVHAAVLAEFVGQALGHAEHPALRVFDILAPHDDLGVARHLLAQRGIDGLDHRHLGPCEVRLRFLGHGQLVREHVPRDVVVLRMRIAACLLRSLVDLRLDAGAQVGDLGRGHDAGAQHLALGLQHRIARDGRLDLGLAAVPALVVGRGVIVQANHVELDQRRPVAGADVADQAGHEPVDLVEGAGAVELVGGQAEALGDPVDLGSRLVLLRHADGVAVVLHDEQHRQALARGPVERFEELSLAGGTLAGGRIDDRVGAVVAHGAGSAEGRQVLGAGGGALRHEPEIAGRPLLGHVDAAGVGIPVTAEQAQEDVLVGHSERDGHALLAVVGVEPVVAWAHQHRHADLHLLVPASRGIEGQPALLEKDLGALLDVVALEHLLVQLPEHLAGNDTFGDVC